MSESRPGTCELCGEPMPPGEEMFKYHGYSGDCPKPPLPRSKADTIETTVTAEKSMTSDDEDEYEILRYMTSDTHKFVIQVGLTLPQNLQNALERLMLRDWIRLIDISPTPTATGDHRLMRVFRAMPAAVEWYERN